MTPLIGAMSHVALVGRVITPVVTTLFFVILGVLPFDVPGLAPGFVIVTPSVALIAVFYWTIFRPELLPHVAVFAIGLVQDALIGLPLGASALVLLVIQAVVLARRRVASPTFFWGLWLAFAAMAALASLLTWVVLSFLAGAVLGVQEPLMGLVVTVAVFPLVVWFLHVVQRVILGRG